MLCSEKTNVKMSGMSKGDGAVFKRWSNEGINSFFAFYSSGITLELSGNSRRRMKACCLQQFPAEDYFKSKYIVINKYLLTDCKQQD
jgi:hypothetical protein